MKSKFLLSSLLLVSGTLWAETYVSDPIVEETPRPGTGAFLGLGLGYGMGPFRSTTALVNTKIPDTTITQKTEASRTSVNGMLLRLDLGWNCNPRNTLLVLGLIGGGAFSTCRGKLAIPDVSLAKGAGGVITRAAGQLTYAKLRDKGFFDLASRFGVIVGRSLLFAKIGWAIHKLQASLNTSTLDYSKGQWANCLLTGLGVDITMSRNIVFGIELNLHCGGKKRFDFSNAFVNGSLDTRPLLVDFMATVKYNFPAMP